MRNKRLMWINKYSGEKGYVKSIQKKKGYFENTFDISEARKFKSQGECVEAMAALHYMGETVNNDFIVIDVND